MIRMQLSLMFGLLIAVPAGAQPATKLTIRWHGQSCFEIESSKGTRIVTDPHAIEPYGRKELTADVVTISHAHNDHNQLGTIKNQAKAKVYQGLKPVGKKLEWNPIDETVRDVKVRTVGVYHDSSEGTERGKNAVFVLEVDGIRVVHLGDLGHLLTPAQVKQIGPVDVLMIPVGGVYTINGDEAKKVVAQLEPRLYVLPMHYGTKVFMDLLPPDEFLDEQPNVKRLPSNKLTIDTEFKPPQPIIAILDFRN